WKAPGTVVKVIFIVGYALAFSILQKSKQIRTKYFCTSYIPTIRRPSSIPTSACSVPLLLSSENTVGDHERKPEVDKDSVKWTKSTTESVLQPSSRKEKSHHRVIELNKVRLLKLQHKKLENLTTEFMQKIRTLAFQGVQRDYKFVAVVVNENCKFVFHADDLHRLPKNL
ncbi:hypothetical protein M5D96_014244, partial [Drosophila gunungcola]